jgi:hypothetical protein
VLDTGIRPIYIDIIFYLNRIESNQLLYCLYSEIDSDMTHMTTSTDINALEKEFGTTSLNHPSIDRTFRLSVWVPTECVGKVIGTKGTVVQHIQRETQARVVSLPDLGDKPWSPVVITGAPGSVMLAYCLVTKITEEEDDVVAEFHNPFTSIRSSHPTPSRRLYGQYGSFVKKLSADHDVRVFVPDTRDAASRDHRDNRDREPLMSLEGPIAAVWRYICLDIMWALCRVVSCRIVVYTFNSV